MSQTWTIFDFSESLVFSPRRYEQNMLYSTTKFEINQDYMYITRYLYLIWNQRSTNYTKTLYWSIPLILCVKYYTFTAILFTLLLVYYITPAIFTSYEKSKFDNSEFAILFSREHKAGLTGSDYTEYGYFFDGSASMISLHRYSFLGVKYMLLNVHLKDKLSEIDFTNLEEWNITGNSSCMIYLDVPSVTYVYEIRVGDESNNFYYNKINCHTNFSSPIVGKFVDTFNEIWSDAVDQAGILNSISLDTGIFLGIAVAVVFGIRKYRNRPREISWIYLP